MTDASYSIELKNISILRNKTRILDDISFKVPEGITTVILGPLGCGKSTFLKTLASIYLPDEGKLIINNKPYNSISSENIKKFRRDTGFVFQDSALWSNKSLYQNLELPLLFHYPELTTEDILKKIRKTLDSLGFEDNLGKRPSDISSGNRKLISFARALVTDPALLMIDGPESSLDFSSLEKIRKILRDLKEKGKTMLICTYDQTITSMLADYLVILYKNRIYAHGLYRDIIKSKDPVIQNILSHVLDRISNFDDDLLNLMNQDKSDWY
ncbi:MAG: ATP-binding cassette domain-containing protein [Spirochaetia bacterium]|jgi:phospholipid/cholesterol/gamma-HCH transport system ATP-binding protein|nr:ATP-binding cassette domain-containing protein [Spirochaetia bacterium]